MATLPLKASCKRNSILLFIFCGQKDFAQMPFTLRYVQYMVTSVLQDQQYMFGVRSLLVDKKMLLMKKDLADVLFRRLMYSDRSSHVSHMVSPSCIKKCSNKFGRYATKFKQVSLLNAFNSGTGNSQWCLTLGKCKRMGKILH